MDKEMLLNKLKRLGFPNEIVDAFKNVKREDFIPDGYKENAYEDTALPIGYGATISRPYTIALMLNLLELKPNQKILEIGSGSGYVLALLYEITKGEIYGVEIIDELAIKADEILENENIKIFNKSGKKGLPEYAPFDRILISASAQDEETVLDLTNQLKKEGVIVASVKDKIVKIKKKGKEIEYNEIPGFAFVPLKD